MLDERPHDAVISKIVCLHESFVYPPFPNDLLYQLQLGESSRRAKVQDWRDAYVLLD